MNDDLIKSFANHNPDSDTPERAKARCDAIKNVWGTEKHELLKTVSWIPDRETYDRLMKQILDMHEKEMK